MSHVTKKANHVFQMDTSNFEIVCTKSFREVIQKKSVNILAEFMMDRQPYYKL